MSTVPPVMNIENISPSSSTHKIGEVEQHDEPSKASQPPRKTMGIAQNQSKSNSGRKVNYDSKYPEDPPGEEASDNARVWMIYNDEAEAYDEDMLSTFRDSIDALLVFAALFSAVVTSFLLQTSAAMQLDYAKITTYLLAEQILLLRANGNATAINAIPSSPISPDTTNYSGLDIAINVLFLLSLTLSLSNALFCILVKQWLTSYSAKIPGTPRIVALTRNLRFLGVQKWKLPQFIGVLPLMLHASLWMFSGGLLIFVWNLDLALFSATIAVVAVTAILYFITLLIPPLFVDCPYSIPFLDAPVRFALSRLLEPLAYAWQWSKHHCKRNLRRLLTGSYPDSLVFRPSIHHRLIYLRSHWERSRVEQPSNVCETVVWLYDYSSNPTICNAAATSFAAILPLESHPTGYHISRYSDQSIVDMLAHRGDFILSLWKTASSPDSSAAIPKSSSQLRLAILPSSPTYNSAIRAELALHSWSYYWLREGRLQHRPQAYWMLNDRANALVGFYSQREDWCRPDFIEYVVDCEDVWNPRSNSWDIHSLDWHGGTHGFSPINGIAVWGLTQFVGPVCRKLGIHSLTGGRRNPVNEAIRAGQLDTLKAFAEAGVDLTQRCPDTPLQNACSMGSIDAVRFLLEQPQVVENTGNESSIEESPFYSALTDGNTELVQLLLDKGVHVPSNFYTDLRALVGSNGKQGCQILDMLDRAWGSPAASPPVT